MSAEDNDQWAKAKHEALGVLTVRANEQDPITYKEFVKKIKAIPDLKYHGDPRLDELLDEISLEEDEAGRGLISVLVVNTAFPHLPSDGFFELAAGRHPPDASRQEIFERASLYRHRRQRRQDLWQQR
jgi:hypothetical protein